jgi:prophage antirepressor-like protein
MEIFGMSITAHGTRRRPLYLVEDVADWLEYEDVSSMLQNVDDDETVKMILPTEQCLADLQPGTEYQFLTEHGLYGLLMQSQTPQAKSFRNGVKQVLHDVRTGTGIMQGGDDLIMFGVTRALHRYFAAG